MVYISVVAPMLNEEDIVDIFLTEVGKELEKIDSKYEIIVVDDGSIDKTPIKLTTKALLDDRIIAICLAKTSGQHHAIKTGLTKSTGEWVVVMDGDLQDSPKEIRNLLTKAIDGNQIVFANRTNRPIKISYALLQRIFYMALNIISGFKFDYRQANFSIINKRVVEAYLQAKKYEDFYPAAIRSLGGNIASINTVCLDRLNGKSSYSIKSRLKLALRIFRIFK